MPGYGRTRRPVRRTYRRPARAPIRRRAAATIVQKAVRKAKVARFNRSVRRAVMPMVERKYKVKTFYDAQPIPGAGLAPDGASPLGLRANLLSGSVFALDQGTGTGERLGNTIMNCTLNVRGYIQTNLTGPTTLFPFEVHLLVFKKKNDSTGNTDELIKKPNEAVGPITYQIRDTLMPFNRAAYIIKRHRVFKMSPAPSDGNDEMNSQTSRFPIVRRFAMNIPIAKTLRYDNQSSAIEFKTPNNDWVAFCAYVVAGNGQSYSSGNSLAKIYCDARWSWTDQ